MPINAQCVLCREWVRTQTMIVQQNEVNRQQMANIPHMMCSHQNDELNMKLIQSIHSICNFSCFYYITHGYTYIIYPKMFMRLPDCMWIGPEVMALRSYAFNENNFMFLMKANFMRSCIIFGFYWSIIEFFFCSRCFLAYQVKGLTMCYNNLIDESESLCKRIELLRHMCFFTFRSQIERSILHAKACIMCAACCMKSY